MGIKFVKENSNEDLYNDLLIQELESGNFELQKEDRNLIRKFFLKNLKRVIYITRAVSNNISLKEELIMADDMKFMLPIFDGKNYSIWKKRVSTFLRLKECEDVIKIENKPDNVTEATWKKNDLKAMNYIYGAMSDRQVEFVNEEETSYAIIKKLDDMYLRESTALQICIRNKLEKIKLQDYTESSEFFSEFEKLVIELKDSGATLKEKEKLNYMLRTLPSSLCYIGDLVDVLPEKDQTVDFVKNKIKLYEAKEKEENGKGRSTNSNAFKCEKKKDKSCYKCGKTGHFQHQCYAGTPWRGGANIQRGRGQPLMRGGGRGQPDTQQRQPGYRGRGRGRGFNQRGRGGWFQSQQQQPQQFQQQQQEWPNAGAHYGSSDVYQCGSDLFCTELDFKLNSKNQNNNLEIYNCNFNQIEWILDSGCTDHIINNLNYYSD